MGIKMMWIIYSIEYWDILFIIYQGRETVVNTHVHVFFFLIATKEETIQEMHLGHPENANFTWKTN